MMMTCLIGVAVSRSRFCPALTLPANNATRQAPTMHRFAFEEDISPPVTRRHGELTAGGKNHPLFRAGPRGQSCAFAGKATDGTVCVSEGDGHPEPGGTRR